MSDSAITSGSDGLRLEADTLIMDKERCIQLYKKAHKLRLPKYKALEHRGRSQAEAMESKPDIGGVSLRRISPLYRGVEAAAQQLTAQDETTFVRGNRHTCAFS